MRLSPSSFPPDSLLGRGPCKHRPTFFPCISQMSSTGFWRCQGGWEDVCGGGVGGKHLHSLRKPHVPPVQEPRPPFGMHFTSPWVETPCDQGNRDLRPKLLGPRGDTEVITTSTEPGRPRWSEEAPSASGHLPDRTPGTPLCPGWLPPL